MRYRYLFLLLPIAVIAGLMPLACGTSDSTSGGTGGEGASNTTGTAASAGSGGGCELFFCDGGTDDVVSVTISPTDPVVEVLNGVIPPATLFTATGVTQQGHLVAVTGTWKYSRPDVANLNIGTGSFAATGLLGGVGTVTFETGFLTATTSATVKLRITDDPGAVDPGIKAAFAAASNPDPSMALLYPYDKTVFPRGLLAPVIQWNGGGASDIYYIHATSPSFEFEGYATVPPPSRYAFPLASDVWRKLTDSTSGDIDVAVQRWDGAQAYLPVAHTWTIAPANLAGTIYFWEVNNGNVVRINPGDSAPQAFLQMPAGHGCIACHSVSKNGSRIVAALDGGWSPFATFDAATGANLFYSATSSGFEAISPDGAFVLWRHWMDGGFNSTGYLSLSTFDSTTELAQLNPGGGAPAHPAWSGDSNKIAFSVRTDGNGLDFNHSNLWLTSVDLANASFSNAHQIVANDAARPCVTFPTFGPDSNWIAFERSTQARSRGAQSDIWLTNLDGSVLIPLDRANGVGVLQGAEVSSTYEPTFMPLSAGGYFWLVVVGERTYGNTLTDTNPGSRHKQLWVTAIDANPQAGSDPSHPAFWLPGQELNNNNMRGEWALSPCKQIGESCSAGYECCAGFCHDDGNGNFTCTDQTSGCSQIGEICQSAADCCDPTATCTGGFCAQGIPG